MPLTKSFTPTTKSSYPHAFEFTSSTIDVTSLQQFYNYLVIDAALGKCLLKGEIDKELVSESRAGSTSSYTPTEWVCFDFDDIDSMASVDNFLHLLGDPDHIFQYSASHGIQGQGTTVKVHVFVMLSEPINPIMLKQWITQLNMTDPVLRAQCSLTKTGSALSYVLDPTVAQNDKLLYIAPPICDPEDLDTFKTSQKPRIELKTGSIAHLSTKRILAELQPKDQIRSMIETRINELRDAAKLPRRKSFIFKIDKATGTEYLDKPGTSIVTGHKTDRGFVYLNINGGDSWAYYYPETDNTFVFNFKDEPVYKLQQLDPDFYKSSLPDVKKANQAAQQAKYTIPSPASSLAQKLSPKLYLVFRDNKTAIYYNAIYDITEKKWDSITRAASERQLVDFMLQYGQPEPEVIPIWDLVFNPQAPAIDIPNRKVNLYEVPTLITQAEQHIQAGLPLPTDMPPTIYKIIWSVVGEDQPTFDHFINWVRFVVQEKTRAQTAWLFNGVSGTGKGLLAHRILRPLVGMTNSSFFDASVLEDKFNDSLESSILTVIDELTISDLDDSSKIMSSLKSRITEPSVVVRKMRVSPYEAPNFNNYVCFSNSKEQIVIEATDRRYNVGMYQTKKLEISDNEINDVLPSELLSFAVWLLSKPADHVKARKIIFNQARTDMQSISMNSIDTVAKLLLEGNLEELYDMRVNQAQVTGQLMETSFRYTSLLDDIIYHDITNLQREQVMLFFQHCAGATATSPIKVTKFLAHHGVYIKPVRCNGMIVKGFHVDWKYDPEWYEERKAELNAKRAPKKEKQEQ